MSTFYKVFTTALAVLLSSMLAANNIQVSNTKLTGQNTTDDYTLVQFDLSWENSWRTNDLNGNGVTNWDAAWVFIKYRVGAGEWQHAWLNDAGHSSGTGTGATIAASLRTPGSAFDATTNPAVGVFIYRSADGTGAFSITGAQLRWNYGANGVADDAIVDVKVFAIEMVYVPEGAFAAGSGGSESSAFTLTTINTANATTAPAGTGGFNGSAQGGYPTGQTAPDNASWPNGYGAFYSMKYKISQQQYVDFLNTLTVTQAANRYSSSSTGNRYGIAAAGGVYSTTNPYVACNYLSWMDGAAYSDWAGLRPMTELEYEKACRGTIAPVANEYVWGTATLANTAYTLSNSGLTNEGIATNYSTTAGNASYSTTDGSIDGPLRVGIFAGHASNTGRITAGASYYGIMELSGNLWERPVTVGNVGGRAYTGVHGDGTLSTNGHATEAAWPGLVSGEVTDASGSGFRGGSWDNDATNMRVSDREYATFPGTFRSVYIGFRAVRSGPSVCGESQITDIDGNVYNTVLIGTQCWMAENLRTTTYANGDPIPNATSIIQWEYYYLYTGAWVHYNNDSQYENPYGKLYSWYTVANPRNVCPTGWHVPSDAEWSTFINYLDPNADGGSNGLNTAGGKMKSTGTQYWASPNTDATNESGFSGLPGGIRYFNGAFTNIGYNGFWWSSTEDTESNAWIRTLFNNFGNVTRDSSNKIFGFSVRCLRD